MSADNKNNIITAAFWIGLLVHLMGYFLAGEYKNINIYLLTAYFNMNMLGLVTLIVGNTAGLREGGVFLMVLGTYFFYDCITIKLEKDERHSFYFASTCFAA